LKGNLLISLQRFSEFGVENLHIVSSVDPNALGVVKGVNLIRAVNASLFLLLVSSILH